MTQDIYHDYYDLALMPISLGDIITWGVKSALRADAVGRKRVHIHFICDRDTGLSHFHNKSYAVEPFTFELLPIFSTHPYYGGITVHSSRQHFEDTIHNVLAKDPVNLGNYKMHQSLLEKRGHNDEINKAFQDLCSKHDDVNECYAKTGAYPKPRALDDFTFDIQTMKAEFPKDTFWVAVQFRLRMMDTGMPITNAPDAFVRDAPFVHWHNFFLKTLAKHPRVRFILLGRLQEKPLEILRMANVVCLRPLGMNIGQELAALLDADLYMGSPSGFAQLAHFSEVPYDIFNCTKGGCIHYGIPFGITQLPIATSRQRLHYGVEDSQLLCDTLDRALQEAPPNEKKYEVLQTTRTSTTHRFFINDTQSKAEVINTLAGNQQRLALLLDRGKYEEAQKEFAVIEESFSKMIADDPKYSWISQAVLHFSSEPGDPQELAKWQVQSREYAVQISSYLHPQRLIRQSGRFIIEIPIASGMNRDGWCEQETRIVFGPSYKGNFFVLQFSRLAADAPNGLSVFLNQQPEIKFTLLNEPCVIEIPVLEDYVHTEVVLKFELASRYNTRDASLLSAQIDRAGVVSERTPAPKRYIPDKADPTRGPSSGIYTTGRASSHVWLRIDNPFPENKEIMVQIIGFIPYKFRGGQDFSIQINDGEKYQSHIAGKHLEALVPCQGRPRHLLIRLEFTDKNSTSAYDLENRAEIVEINILPGTRTEPVIKTGTTGHLAYILRRIFSRRRSKK